MDEALGKKRAETLSTASLDSTYDNDNGEPTTSSTTTEQPDSYRDCICKQSDVLLVVILLSIGLALVFGRDTIGQGDERYLHSSLTSGQNLPAPQKKLAEWLKQINNASELYVEGASGDTSLTGVLFPRNGSSDESLSFDAMIAINTSEVLPRRQYVAWANGKGSKWVVTSLGNGDSIATNTCLTANQTLPFEEFNSIVKTAYWSSSDREGKSEVKILFSGEKYIISEEENDYDYESSCCWLVENEDEVFELRVCIPELMQFSKADFADLFHATSGCPQLGATPTNLSVPLPLRKWYASYKA